MPLGPDPRSGLWEFGHVLTGEIPQRDPSTGELTIAEDTGVVFVLLPGDTFVMGAQADDAPWADANEYPAHEVTLSAFFLSKFEMTQGQWKRVMGENPSFYGPDGDWESRWSHLAGDASLLHPVERVSWTECVGALGRVGLVLPTEAQWEYAARGGTQTLWWSGSNVASLAGVANLADAYAKAHGGGSSWPYEELDDGFVVHAAVGSFLDNPVGLFDVHGNVWEWCRDVYGGFGLPVAPGDGERLAASSRNRVSRGGGFRSSSAFARSALRSFGASDYSGYYLGLRPARVITGPSTTGR